MLCAIRYLGNDTITGINQIEDWYLPKDAFKTKFTDAAGRVLYLVGTKEQIRKEDHRMDQEGAIMHHYGHTFTYKGPKPVRHHAAQTVKKVAPVVVVKTPVANTVANTSANT